MKNYLLAALSETPWAIVPAKLAIIEEIIERHIAGEKLTAEEVTARLGGTPATPQPRTYGAVKVLPLFGTIFPRANLMTDVSGATSAERFGAEFTAAVNDPAVRAIVMDVNSPGGQVSGVSELSQRIYDARGKKPIVAVANHLMASAAYWIASAADEIVASPTSEIGSVGVIAAHKDISRSLENDGVKMTVFKAGKYKAEGNPYEPLTDEARAAIQSDVNDYYDLFVESLSRNRNASAEEIKNGFGEGRALKARAAIAARMADSIGTLEQTVERLSKNLPQTPQSNAAPRLAEIDQRAAHELRERISTILKKE